MSLAALNPEELVREHMPRVYSLAYRLLGNEADAEDVTQEVLLRVLRKLDTFRGESAFPTWLHRVTVNAALRYRQQRAQRQGQRSSEPLDEIAEGATTSGPVRKWSWTPEQQVLNEETQRKIEEAIAKLPPQYRDVYVLADVEGLPNQEIADTLGLGVAAVKSRLHRARLLMRASLAPYFEDSTP